MIFISALSNVVLGASLSRAFVSWEGTPRPSHDGIANKDLPLPPPPLPTMASRPPPGLEHFAKRRKSLPRRSVPWPLAKILLQHKRLLLWATATAPLMLVASTGSPAFAATTAAPTTLLASSSRNAVTSTLGKKQLVLASLLVSTAGGMTLWHRGLPRLAKQILWSCARCSMQLYILGAMVLQRLMGATKPAIVASWFVVVGIVAAQQAHSHLEHTYDALFGHLLLSILASTALVLGLSLCTGMLGENRVPWFAPRTVIPVAGMLFGNAVSATSLAATSLTQAFVQQQAALELRLTRGASTDEALQPLTRSSLTNALTPTINSLAVTGTVHIPGMMTGSLLAGQSPQKAAAYQALILFLIASTSCISVQLLTSCVTHQLVDYTGVRLALNRLKPNERDASGSRFNGIVPWLTGSTTMCNNDEETATVQVFAEPMLERMNGIKNLDSAASAVLRIENLRVPRAGQKVSFAVGAGDRVGIIGPSGSGKTQLLRALAGLEPVNVESVLTFKSSSQGIAWPEWRRRGYWVSQDRPILEGFPEDHYNELQHYKSRRNESVNQRPEDIAKSWNLEPNAFHQSWATLSGGEAQRASLAIALSLEPHVLLLDEALSGLDGATQILVEKTLLERKVPIIMVTHSNEQLQRFCTHKLELVPRQ